MKIISKNHSLINGIRGYLVYLVDDNSNPLNCYEVSGEGERIEIENKLSSTYNLTDKDMEYVSLEQFKSQNNISNPIILVFYLNMELFIDRGMIKMYGENISQYMESRGDDVRLFFIPTDGKEEIKCINPVYVENESELERLDNLIKDISEKFQISVQ
jgi:hypothetical protein